VHLDGFEPSVLRVTQPSGPSLTNSWDQTGPDVVLPTTRCATLVLEEIKDQLVAAPLDFDYRRE